MANTIEIKPGENWNNDCPLQNRLEGTLLVNSPQILAIIFLILLFVLKKKKNFVFYLSLLLFLLFTGIQILFIFVAIRDNRPIIDVMWRTYYCL